MALADVQTLIIAGNTLLSGGDAAGAKLKYLQAKGLLAATPDSSHGQASMRFRASELDGLIKQCDAITGATLSATAGGMQRTKMNYVNPCGMSSTCCDN